MTQGMPSWLAQLEVATEAELPLWFALDNADAIGDDPPWWVIDLEAAAAGDGPAWWVAELVTDGFADELEVLKNHRLWLLNGGVSALCECGGSWTLRSLTGGASVVGCLEVGAACQVLEDCGVLPAFLTVTPGVQS